MITIQKQMIHKSNVSNRLSNKMKSSDIKILRDLCCLENYDSILIYTKIMSDKINIECGRL